MSLVTLDTRQVLTIIAVTTNITIISFITLISFITTIILVTRRYGLLLAPVESLGRAQGYIWPFKQTKGPLSADFWHT